MIHATWMNLGIIKLRGRSQTKGAIYCTVPFIGNVQNRQVHRDRKYNSGCQGWGGQRNGE